MTAMENHQNLVPIEKALSIGEILVASGRLSPQDVLQITMEQARSRVAFGQAALKLNLLTMQELESALSSQFGFSYLTDPQAGVSQEVVAAYEPQSKVSEQVRSLRIRLLLQQAAHHGSRSVAIASAQHGEGRSFIAANLAVVFAQLGERTLLIDADMRNPRQHTLFGLECRAGLSSCLSGRAGIDCASPVQELRNLSVMTAGPMPPNPQELLARSTFTRLLLEAGEVYEAIVIDTPPVTGFADAQIVAARAGATVLVTRSHRTEARQAQQAAAALRDVGARLCGAVVNG